MSPPPFHFHSLSAYPALVKTICELFGVEGKNAGNNGSDDIPVDSEVSEVLSLNDVSIPVETSRISPLNVEITPRTPLNEVRLSPLHEERVADDTTTVTSYTDNNTDTDDDVVGGAVNAFSYSRNGGGDDGGHSFLYAEEFLMSWNRRIAESAIFFDLMAQAGFKCEHKGKCVYSFTL